MSVAAASRFQRIKHALIQFTRFAIRSSAFRSLLLIVAGGAVGCMLVDQLVLDESSFFYGVSTAVVLLLKSIVFVAIAFATNKFVAEVERDKMATNPSAYKIFKGGSKFVVSGTIVVMALASVVRAYQGRVFVDSSPYIFSYELIALCIALCIGQLICLERVLNIRRSKNVRIFRFVAMASFAVMLVVRSFTGASGVEVYAPFWSIIIGTICISFFFAILNIKWTSTFTRDEKWKGIGWAILAIVVQSLLMALLDSELNDSAFVHEMIDGIPIITGAGEIVSASSVLIIIFYVRIMFSLLLALPTATVVDRKNAEVRSLSYLTKSIVHVRELPELMARVTELVRSVCGATGMWIELRNEVGARTISHSMGLNHDQLQLFQDSAIFQEYVARQEPQPVLIDSVREMKELGSISTFADYFAKSLIVIPLLVDDVIIGRLVATHNQEFAFDEQDVSLLVAFVDNISVAIDNARLFENSLEKERLKQELMVAREMQFKLLPPKVPIYTGYNFGAYCSPALEVGGDYYDFITLADGSQCVVIGDVSGKGISAAFYMAEVKGIVMALAKQCSSPKELLIRINTIIKGEMDKRSYITMAALAVSNDGVVRYSRAGHTPLVHRVKNEYGYTTKFLQPQGLGIGLVKSESFAKALEEIEWAASDGDMYLLFTDGLNEAQNEKCDEFGMDRIESTLNSLYNADAGEIVGAMLRKASEFSGGAAQHDDLTLIAIERA